MNKNNQINIRQCLTKMITRVWKCRISYLFLLPFASIFLLFTVAPVIISMLYSFTYNNLLEPAKFIGFANYQALWNDKVFWEVLGNTAQFMLMTVIINVVLALLVASALKHNFIGGEFLRVLFYAPGILAVSVLGIIGLILGVNHFLDMCRTTLNVTGDLLVGSYGYQQVSVDIANLADSSYYAAAVMVGLSLIHISEPTRPY